MCPACPHTMESHDPLGIRFCAATANGHFERKCICVGGQDGGMHYGWYKATNKG